MTPEILAKIMGIIAKTGERVIVIDPRSNTPFVLMNLDEYEKMTISGVISRSEGEKTGYITTPNAGPIFSSGFQSVGQHLTQNKGTGIIDPELALLNEAKKVPTGDWGGDETEEDRYYMEPAE